MMINFIAQLVAAPWNRLRRRECGAWQETDLGFASWTIDFEDNFAITVEHYRHCRRFCDGQSLHVQREPTAFNKERATDSISINYKL